VETVNRAILQAYAHIPQRLRRTLTLDNGLEFAGFKNIEKTLGLDVYFADPYIPTATIAKANGNLRCGYMDKLPPKSNVLH
jgi:transposase, IS30 family